MKHQPIKIRDGQVISGQGNDIPLLSGVDSERTVRVGFNESGIPEPGITVRVGFNDTRSAGNINQAESA